MIAYTLEAAHNSGLFDRIIVSTDDEEIASVALAHGGEVPFVRPANLADDHTGTVAVIAHAIKTLNIEEAEAVCCLYATAPFLRSDDLHQALRALFNSDKLYAFPVTTFPYPIHRALLRQSNGTISMAWPEYQSYRSQDLPETYHDAGQFYWGRPKAWLSHTPIFSDASTTILLPRYLVHDIDTPEDWERAELIHQALFP